MSELTLPASLSARATQVPPRERHAGLQLDKYSAPANQEGQREPLEDVCRAAQSPDLLAQLARRRALARVPGGVHFRGTTISPLTLHLARTSALENVGLCLHPIYGFAYLPGTALKGMSRAWAQTHWLPLQPDRAAAQAQLDVVFGLAPSGGRAQAGAVCFHDACPVDWPALGLDISNNHHADYYDGADAPGDWHAPNPITFLTIQPGATFEFDLTMRDPLADVDTLQLARQWLVAALTQLGAGAKTSMGYGVFRVDGAAPAPLPASRASRAFEVELVTPAFLAGAVQGGADCALRAATLRGLLRWWWRTLHVAHLSTEALRDLEATLWGNTKQSAAIRVEVLALDVAPATPFDREQVRRSSALPAPPDAKTSQGLTYHSYGMDEVRRGERRRRHVIEPGARWRVVFSTRQTRGLGTVDGDRFTAAEALGQAHAALSLLCSFGGTGSKARKGFGNLALVGESLDRAACVRIAAELRRALPAGATRRRADISPNDLDTTIDLGPISTPWSDVWYALDAIGTAAQAFAKRYKHRREKVALGLPRSIHRREESEPLSVTHAGTRLTRHASPVHYRVDRQADGTLAIRVTMFPSPRLPDLAQSRTMLTELRASLEQTLLAAIAAPAPRGRAGHGAPGGRAGGPASARSPAAGTRAPAPTPPARPAVPQLKGTDVTVRLLEEKKPKGQKNKKWFVETLDGVLKGFIENSSKVRGKAGDELTVHVKSQDGAEAIFELR